MFLYFYTFSLAIYGLIVRFFSFFNTKAKLFVEGRERQKGIWNKAFDENSSPIYWFHCASLGEFEQARPLIEKFKDGNIDIKILLTFFSPSGFEVRKNYSYADWVLYLPIDSKKNAKLIFDKVKPSKVFFVKYELWYFYIREALDRKIEFYLISATFRPNHFVFKPYAIKFLDLLKGMNHIFVQDEESKLLLANRGVQSTVANDTRFDRVTQIAKSAIQLNYIKRLKGKNKLFVIGSAWKEDIKILYNLINSLFLYKDRLGTIKVVIAPHEINSKNIDYIKKHIKRPFIAYSECESKDLSLYDVLIVDNVGLLASIYAYADVAYVGGAFGKGLHNILEPAVFGVPLFFGNKISKFPEASKMIEHGGAYSVDSAKDMETKFFNVMESDELNKKMGIANKKFIENNVGATNMIYSFITQQCLKKD